MLATEPSVAPPSVTLPVLRQCQSNCPGKAYVRVAVKYSPNERPVSVDLCNHHYNKLVEREEGGEAIHTHTILVDKRDTLYRR